MNNIIYFSGIHGTGKSTLIEALTNRHPQIFIPYKKLEVPKNDYTLEREIIRYCRFYLQAFYQKEIASKNLGKYVLCDRSLYDQEGYALGFLKRGWLTEEECARLIMLKNLLFSKELLPKKLVFVNPPLEYIKENIRKRWKKTEKIKWNEDDFTYLEAVYESYPRVIERVDCEKLILTETKLEDRVDNVCDWLKIPIQGIS